MTETNPFICFIPKKTRILIVGSFPCFNGRDYGDWFYSGSGRNHFWQLLSDVYGMSSVNAGQKKALCERHGIALTDVAFRIKRKLGNCSDSNLQIIDYNPEGMQKCMDARPKKIFFTSRFVETHFKKNIQTAIPSVVLPSPSPAANKHIGGLDDYKSLIRLVKIRSTYEFRLLRYRELLNF